MSPRLLARLLPAPAIRRVQAMLFSLLGLRWTLATGIELRILSATDWTLYNDIFVEGEYDQAIRAMVRAGPRGEKMTVVDLGANVGFFSLRLFHLLGLEGISPQMVKVCAVEPSPANLAELGRRMALQKEWGSRVAVVPGLVGKKRSGSAKLFESHNCGSNTLFDELRYPGAREIEADYVDLDKVVPDGDIVHLLKCDIEGAELEVVRTYPAFLSRVRIAIFEVHHEVCDVVQVKACLGAAGLSDERILANRGNTSVRMYVRQAQR